VGGVAGGKFQLDDFVYFIIYLTLYFFKYFSERIKRYLNMKLLLLFIISLFPIVL